MGNVKIIKGGRIIDPVNGRDEVADLWLAEGKVVASQAEIPGDAEVIEAGGCWVVPGLIDIHVHLREPGQEYKENVASGTQAAAAGGFTAVACMPNTSPVNDNGSVTQLIMERAEGCAARVYPVGAISKGSKGESLADYAEMKEAGIVAVTDDGMPVVDSQLMRRAMEYAASHKLVVMSHSEEETLARNGCMNEGPIATQLGLRGIPRAAESIMIYREVALAELTGTHVHIAHVSCEDSLAVIRLAKERGVKVTAETAPHYFILTDEAVIGYNTNAKMNPPLRSEQDREAIKAALVDGTLDVIATDHAPHSVLEKELEFNYAANGITGLETALSLTLALVRDGVISERRMVELMSVNPARIIGVEGGELGEGAVADITVIDPDAEYVFTAESSLSKGKNSPFNGWKLKGRAMMTLVDGEVRYRL